jgi:hypothetical protein
MENQRVLYCKSWMQRLPKLGEKDSDCQDFADRNEDGNFFSIADGVSNSSLPADWSRLLVQYACENPEITIEKALTDSNILQKPREEWEELRKKKAKAAWWLSSQQAVSASTLLFALSKDQQWHLDALGDSCAFLWRKQQDRYHLEDTFPLTKASDFNISPACFFSSFEVQKQRGFEPPKTKKIAAQEGDLLFLATDALAKWLYGESDEERYQRFESCKEWVCDTALFKKHIDQEREQGRMDDDDVTLVILELVPEKDSSTHFQRLAPSPPPSFRSPIVSPKKHEENPSKAQAPSLVVAKRTVFSEPTAPQKKASEGSTSGVGSSSFSRQSVEPQKEFSEENANGEDELSKNLTEKELSFLAGVWFGFLLAYEMNHLR